MQAYRHPDGHEGQLLVSVSTEMEVGPSRALGSLICHPCVSIGTRSGASAVVYCSNAAILNRGNGTYEMYITCTGVTA